MEIELLCVIFVIKAVIPVLDQRVDSVLGVRKNFSTTKDRVYSPVPLGLLPIEALVNAFRVPKDVRFAHLRFIMKKVERFINFVRSVKRIGNSLETLL